MKITTRTSLCSVVLSVVCFWIVDGANHFEVIGIERYESAIQLEHEEGATQLQDVWNADEKERRKACTVAQTASRIKKFVYIPHHYRPEIRQYTFLNPIQKPPKPTRDSPNFSNFLVHHSNAEEEDEDSEESEQSLPATFGTFAMYCGTLPSVYVRISISQSENMSTKYLKAVLIESAFDPFQIRKQDETPKAVLSGELQFRHRSVEEFRDNPLVELNPEDRRSLCVTASENHPVTFFGNHVSEARVYELEYSSAKKETIVGVRCPVLPPVILHQKDRLKPFNLTFIRTSVDEYSYGGFATILMSRYDNTGKEELLKSSILSRDDQAEWSFCMLAQKELPASKRNLFTIDNTRIGVARVYSFVYPDRTETNYVAVQCAEAPTIFVYLDESKKEVKVLVFSSTADKLNVPDPEPSTSHHHHHHHQLRIFTE